MSAEELELALADATRELRRPAPPSEEEIEEARCAGPHLLSCTFHQDEDPDPALCRCYPVGGP